ncbi:MAG: hypothetical protein WBE69_02870, partial [Candidatus Binataceae bacterium]
PGRARRRGAVSCTGILSGAAPPVDHFQLGTQLAGGAVAIRAMHEARPVQEILLDALGDYLKK